MKKIILPFVALFLLAACNTAEPVSQTSQKFAEDDIASYDSTTQTFTFTEAGVEKIKTLCPLDWAFSESENFSYCYKNSWGEPTINDETSEDGKGELFHLTFANNENKGNGDSTPNIWWESKDFAPTAGDYSTTCFDCIDFNQSEAEILKAVGLENKGTLQKVITKRSGKQAVRLHLNYIEPAFEQGQINRLQYLVPNAFGDYHFQAIISYDKAEELDTFMDTITFNETPSETVTQNKYEFSETAVFDTEVSGYYHSGMQEIMGAGYNVANILITDYKDPEFKEALEKEGRSELIDGSYTFQIGCSENGKIESLAKIDDATQQAILKSTKEKPITLTLLFREHSGTDYPCLSQAQEIKVK